MFKEMEETRDDETQAVSVPSSATWSPSDLMEKLQTISLVSSEVTSNGKAITSEHEQKGLSSQGASQILWATGQLSEPIPNGFYSIIAERGIKEHFDTVPSLDELHTLDTEGLGVDVILVDEDKDKKLCMLKQLCMTLVKGLNSNSAVIIKKIAGLVYDFYKRPNLESSPEKAVLEEVSYKLGSHGVHLLGQIKHGLCHPRAILFKVLADSVGLDSRLMMGLPSDGAIERTDSHKHMSVIVVLNSVEMLVDLVRFPGQLIPFSTKAVLMSHISAAAESDSVDNDSCDSPLEPNSPNFGFSDQVDIGGAEHSESLQSSFQHKVEDSIYVSRPSPQKIMLRSNTMVEGTLNSLSQSEPNIANAFWRRSRKKVIAETRTASSSPERPLFRVHGRSILGGHRGSFRGYENDMAVSRSAGASPSDTNRRRRRSISVTPEIGDDVVRAVRAMNETLKRNRLPSEQFDVRSSYLSGIGATSNSRESVQNFHSEDSVENSGARDTAYNRQRKQMSFQKAMSLPTSPRRFSGQTSRTSVATGSADVISAWSRVLESSSILKKTLLPFQEWNIDFSELTVGTRVGIGFFGEVFRGRWNGTDVAIKVFLEQDLTIENVEDFCNEISILSRLRHPNVILFLGACTKPPRLSMVTEYMEMGSLYYLIHVSGQKNRLSWRKRLKMLCDICRGLMCIHRMKIVHRDLKSANCLVDKNWTVKICDFGLSRVLTTTPITDSSSAGTPEWMAPELICNKPFTEKCDIFSLGVIIWELCTLKRPWEGVPSVQVVYAVGHDGVRLEIPEGPLGKIIADCWAEPDERPSCEEILSRLLACKNTLN